MQQRKKIAIIVAGGSGVRMGSSIPKQFLELEGRPVLYHTIHAFLQAYPDMEVILVVPAEHFSYVAGILQHFPGAPIQVIAGGETRFHSVKNGLAQVREPAVVFIQDGVRPLLSSALIHRCYEAALAYGNAIPVLEMKDSVRQVDTRGNRAVDRQQFRIIQTPQTFLSELILAAFALPYDPLFTDEATVIERLGHQVHLVEGEEANIKITRPQDLLVAAALLKGSR
ncbi:2-C-methyl-D-erythritol 4-phosphate cytidylyltransferase [Chitinophaga pendula]|uniref:2-C-methyl-D-erythritol 4-phosphate cytidylyltransferase n=1 Tax=Chitinophaga TaxID=79328 RepID=UPI000BAF1970|nr:MULTISPECIES: 2-C-methyl-D-erythritol 4-phosphate cytidylyltransferase [Chitinophaga]ASZ11164.1 2-C-methyl-D-erythritol 4-phosphate cytidylyltransferase [Chitinophaga sp. MD30]UCJ05840.1 2-C-methyl-D-erythritol 4-phosphate cytidylyltransferase [Chitinophaga pendula]